MDIRNLLLAIAETAEQRTQITLMYRTITPEQREALETAIAKLLPVHQSQLEDAA